MTAPPDTALHVAFQRELDVIGRHSGLDEQVARDLHQDIGPAQQCGRRGPVEVELTNDIGHEPHETGPIIFGRIDRLDHLDATRSPLIELPAEQQVGAGAGTDDDDHAADRTRTSGKGEDRRTQRCEAEPTGGDHHVAGERVEVPTAPERPADPQLVSRLQSVQRRRDRARLSNRVLVVIAHGRRRADRDRCFPDPVGADHPDLRRHERSRRTVDRYHVERHHARGLGHHGTHDVHTRGCGNVSGHGDHVLRSPLPARRGHRLRRSGRCRRGTT